MSLIKIMSLLAVLATSTEAVVFLCDYKMVTLPLLGEIYACEAVALDIGISSILIRTAGNHLNGRTDRDVEFLQVRDPTRISSQIIGRITYFFPNLYAFHWLNGGLRTTSASDLEPFTKLQSFAIESNLLVTLQADLLSNTPNLRVVDFRNNNIELVGAGLLDNLNDLNSVLLGGNICISMNASTPEELQLLSDALTNQCASATSTTTEQLQTTPEILTTPGDVTGEPTQEDSTVTEDASTVTGEDETTTIEEDSTVTEDQSTITEQETTTTEESLSTATEANPESSTTNEGLTETTDTSSISEGSGRDENDSLINFIHKKMLLKNS